MKHASRTRTQTCIADLTTLKQACNAREVQDGAGNASNGWTHPKEGEEVLDAGPGVLKQASGDAMHAQEQPQLREQVFG